MDRSTQTSVACVLLILTASAAPFAHADDSILPTRDNVAGSRPQPLFESAGISWDTWTAVPQLRADTGYDSNLFGSTSQPKGDGYVILSPALDIRKDVSPHHFDLSARGSFTRFWSHPKQHSNEYALHAGGEINLGQVVFLPTLSHSLISERRGVNGAALSTGHPSQFRLTAQGVEARIDLASLSASLTVSHEDISYNTLVQADGTKISQHFRDSNSWAVKARTIYTPSDIAAFGLSTGFQHAENSVSHRTNDQMDIQATVGIDTGMFRAEGAAGYLWRNFSNPTFRDFNGLVYAGSLHWYPTPLISLAASGHKSLENSGIPSVGIIKTHSWRTEAEYELLRNFVLHAEYSERHQNFPEVNVHAVSRTKEIKGEYRFNRTVAFGAYARRECRDSSDPSAVRGFCTTLGGVSLTWRR